MKVLILGHGGHGKDTVAEIITELSGLRFVSSSWAACEKVVFPALREKYHYATAQECYDDRRNHRREWFDLIASYNTPDKGRLCREILAEADGYIGMRCVEEYIKTHHLFDLIIFVYAWPRLDFDDSMTIPPSKNMVLIDNNHSIDATRAQLQEIFREKA